MQYKRRRIDAQSSSEPHDPCSIKHKKPLESLLKADEKIPSKQGEEKDEVHTLDNQQEKSSSLNYMLIGEAKENHVQNVAESAKEDIPTELIQSKIIFMESKQTTFSGFQNTSIQELDLQRKKFRGRPDNLSIDINVKAQPESGTHTDEVFARGYKIISDFLDKAREKYFFADDSTPSFRISEDVDECGNIIKEHELWRPVWMKDECYKKKIEATKLKITKNFKEVQPEEVDICVQGNTNLKKQGSSSSNYKLSIHCAQREVQRSLMCETPQPPKPVEEIVDLTTPEVQMSTGWNHMQTCYSPCKNNNEYTSETPPLKMKKDYSMVPIIGKRLFAEEESCQQESSGSKRNPVQLMEEKTEGQAVSVEKKMHHQRGLSKQAGTVAHRTTAAKGAQ
uniref:Uncharacterized protein n=1 Tax=Triticum urartu TaxID=4572 RepID=A0A8R7QRX5_TRIUA